MLHAPQGFPETRFVPRRVSRIMEGFLISKSRQLIVQHHRLSPPNECAHIRGLSFRAHFADVEGIMLPVLLSCCSVLFCVVLRSLAQGIPRTPDGVRRAYHE